MVESGYGIISYKISIYQISSMTLIRQMGLDSPNPHSSLAFSSDEKYVASVSHNDTSSQVVLWGWSKEKAIATTMIGERINRLHFNPSDSLHITASGTNAFKQLRLNSDNTLKATSLANSNVDQEIADHTWLMDDWVVAVSDSGRLWVLERVHNVMENRQIKNLKFPDHAHAESIVGYSKGFIIGGSAGLFSIYERSGDVKDPFMHIKSYCVGDKDSVCSIAISPQGARACLYLKSNQLTMFPLGQYDVIPEGENGLEPLVGNGAHTAPITCMKACIQKPIIVTASGDHTVKVWNYLTWKCDVVQYMQDEPTALAINPNGLQLCIGFKERVRVYNIFVDSIKHFQDLGLKNCKQLEYSNGGQYIAAVVGINVLIYRTYHLSCIATFTGHIQPSAQLVWSDDDTRIFSAGLDGGIYGWDINTRSRVEDICCVVKSCKYSGIDHVQDPDNGDTLVASGNDGKLRVINNNGEISSYEMEPYCLTRCLLSRCKKFLFVGTTNGTIRVFNWPIRTASFNEYTVHDRSASVTHLILAGNKYLFSAGSDGTLFALAVNIAGDLESMKVDTTLFNMDSILVAKEDYEEKLTAIADLLKKVDEDRSNASYELNSERNVWTEKLRHAQQSTQDQMEAERVRYETIQHEHEQYIKETIEDREKLEREHQLMTKEMENQFEHKLALEMERFDQLSEETEFMKQKYEQVIKKMNEDNIAHNHQMKNAHALDIQNLNAKIKQLHQDLKYNAEKFEEVLAQQEGEYEGELTKVKEQAKLDIQKEQTTLAMKEGHLGKQKNVMDGMRKKVTKMEEAQKKQEDEYKVLLGKYTTLQETLKHFENHLDEREFALADKEQTILSLQCHNRTLDNFRFVLDNRISQLTEDQGPILEHVDRLERHISKVYEELVTELEKKKEASRLLAQKDIKIEICNSEIHKLRAAYKDAENICNSFARDLENAVKFSNHADDWEDAVKKLYRLYCKNEKDSKKSEAVTTSTSSKTKGDSAPKKASVQVTPGGVETSGDGNHDQVDAVEVRNLVESKTVIQELMFQRDHNVKSNHILKRSLKIAEDKLAAKTKQTMGENSMLINECNNLRRANKILSNKVEEMTNEIKGYIREIEFTKRQGLKSSTGSRSAISTSESMPESPTRSADTESLPSMGKVSFPLKKSLSTGVLPKQSLLPTGKLAKGGMKQLEEAENKRRVALMLSQLDEVTRENETLRSENRSLKSMHLTFPGASNNDLELM
jgi:WD40 repeat protein